MTFGKETGSNFDKTTLKAALGRINGHDKIYQPYIKQVEHHWYRNQYFTNIENDLFSLKQAAKLAITNVYTILYPDEMNPTEESDEIQPKFRELKEKHEQIESQTTAQGVMSIINSIKASLTIPEEKQEEIDKEFNSLENNEFIGSAYKLIANPAPTFVETSVVYSHFDKNMKDDWGEQTKNIIQASTIREEWDETLEQIHNPLFIDNSQYIRSWLKDKYYIFDGSTDNDTDSENANGTTTARSVNAKKKAEGKQYINGAHALEALKEQMDQATYRSDMQYLLRDIIELCEDFEFDLINTEAQPRKTMQNILPDYVPYTPWPSTYEKNETNTTKMILKTNSTHRLVAPATGTITSKTEKGVEIEFTDTLNFGITMKIEAEAGSININGVVGSTVAEGNEIGSISPSDGIVIIKLQLFNATKQILKAEDYMTVNSKTYNDLTDEERALLLFMIKSEIPNSASDNNTLIKEVGLANVVFNRIASPYYKNETNIRSVIGTRASAAEHGFVLTANNFGSFSQETELTNEDKNNTKYSIMAALNGLDITKEYTVLGATNYLACRDLAIATEWYENADAYDSAKDKFKTKMEIERHGSTADSSSSSQDLTVTFGVTNAEYYEFLSNIVSMKIDEVIYQLNIKRYNRGIAEFDELKEKFKNAKKEITDYYNEATFMDECGGLKRINEDTAKIVYEIVKSNLSQQIKDSTIIDKFTLTVNSNYVVKWQFEYTVGENGEITSDIIVNREPIENY